MAGRMEREARYEKTGLSPVQRDKLIVQLRRRGLTLAEIGKRVGLTPSGTKRALDRLAGVERRQRKLSMCEGCWGDAYQDELNSDGLCPACIRVIERTVIYRGLTPLRPFPFRRRGCSSS